MTASAGTSSSVTPLNSAIWVLRSAITAMRSSFSGPWLVPEEEVPSYPSPAAEGLLWKYSGSGFPSSSVNDCPISDEPTSSPSFVVSGAPFACAGKASCPIPVISRV